MRWLLYKLLHFGSKFSSMEQVAMPQHFFKKNETKQNNTLQMPMLLHFPVSYALKAEA